MSKYDPYTLENVNVRFVDSTVSVQQPYTIMQMEGLTAPVSGGYVLGEVPPPLDIMNANPVQTGMLHYRSFKESLVKWYGDNDTNSIPLSYPNVTADEHVRLWARTAAHETGHALGLVAPDLLNGDSGGHNLYPFEFHLMDPGNVEEYTLYKKMGRDGTVWTFKVGNSDYLRFILPKQ